MSGALPFDDLRSVELTRLVPASELDELIAAITRALGGAIAIHDLRGRRIAGSEAGEPRHDVVYEGELLARLAATGPHAGAALELMTEAVGLVVHHAHARELAALTHQEAMRLTFAELTEHNQRLQRAVSRLEELDRLKSNFLATMSHELRTPLTSVIGYAEMMAEGLAGPISPEQRDYLATILGKADQLLGLITAVLDVATLESGQLAIERCALSLADVVASEVATFVPMAGRRGIAIQLDAHGESVVFGDRRKIRQIVSSLLSNAVKFTPDRGHIGIAVRPGPLAPGGPDETQRAIQLVVSDSGIGVSPDQVSKIFEPFFQVDSSSTRAFGGTGLGLTLAKAYVEAHGGRIWVDTQPGQGSTFVASFPARTLPCEPDGEGAEEDQGA
ncbi:MAG TPA: HAMP domain-containing sensor histidine kinase [Kofleriaceae bacterium]|nr:HAMP domain-containing sensor histidine kinase [Kofleriaceae bacterium]